MSGESLIQTHIDRCLECYAQGGSSDEYRGPVCREAHEIMRGDLLIAIGMLMALRKPALSQAKPEEGGE